MSGKEINIGIIGLGTLGKEAALQLKNYGLNVATCDKDIEKEIKRIPFGTNAKRLIYDSNIKIIVELIGGYTPAYEIIKNSLQAGKNVVTANKAVIDKYGKELENLAIQNKKSLRFEAAAAGAIPIIDVLQNSSIGNETHTIEGILNGTTNYILTRMHQGLDYELALKEAQEKGFAEANPEFDISGKDAAQKLAILSSINFKTKIDSQQIYTKGINGINGYEFDYAKKQGWKIKLLASAMKNGNSLELRVCPEMIPLTNPLSKIDYEINAVYLQGKDKLTFSGHGAGKPAASAVVSDVLNTLKREFTGEKYFGDNIYEIANQEYIPSRFYLRFSALDKPKILEHISGILGNERISIWKAEQLGQEKEKRVPVIIVTYDTNYKALNSALEKLDKEKAEIKSILNISSDIFEK